MVNYFQVHGESIAAKQSGAGRPGNSPQCEARRNRIVYSERPHGILRREMAEDVSVAEETRAHQTAIRTGAQT